MKPKGRPPVIPRLDDLERAVLELAQRIAKLEARIASHSLVPPAYVPQFTRWPANGRS
jgi:hypothetical protein